MSGAFSALDLLIMGSDDATTTSDSASYAAAPVVELVADGHVTVTTGGDRVEVDRTASTALTAAHYTVDEVGDRLRVSLPVRLVAARATAPPRWTSPSPTARR